MTCPAARIRLRRVRFKTGGEIVPLVMREDAAVAAIAESLTVSAGAMTESFAGCMAGWALVSWSDDGNVCVNFRNGKKSFVPSGGVARYVGDVLAAEAAVRWARDD